MIKLIQALLWGNNTASDPSIRKKFPLMNALVDRFVVGALQATGHC